MKHLILPVLIALCGACAVEDSDQSGSDGGSDGFAIAAELEVPSCAMASICHASEDTANK